MAVESIDIPLGSPMPHFRLADPFGTVTDSANFKEKKGVLVAFLCNHCPYAQAIWPRFIRLGAYAQDHGIAVVAINPNINPEYPDDAPEEMVKRIKDWKIPFPYLVDESQNVARAFQAQCTPDIYLFDHTHRLVYHGRIDDNWKDETKVTRHELKEAIDALLNGTQFPPVQYPSMGCSIKWRST
ncbi:MAG: thioredoxin family protein [Bacteroidetes bacterium]|nr:thioredoxin family protein [Bacteroidota bacterium]